MISLPTQFSTGFNASLPNSAICYLIDISMLNSGTAVHLYVTNQPNVNFTLNGSAISANSNFLASVIVNSGSEQTVDGIGEIDLSFDPSQGGTLASVNTVSLILLNQGNFVNNYAYDFENQPVKIYKTFASTMASLTAETDMLKVYDGVITQAYTYDRTQFQIDCVDRRTVDIRYLPQNQINTVTYPHADKNAQNKFVPVVIGDFDSLNKTLYTGLSGHQLGILYAAPTVITDIYQSKAYASDAAYGVSGNIYVTDDSSKYISILSPSSALSASQYSVSTGVNGLTGITVTANYGEVWVIPSALGYHSDSKNGQTIFGGNVLQDFGNAVDSDPTTYAVVDEKGGATGGGPGWNNTNTFLQVQLPSFSEPGLFIPRTAGDYSYDPIGQTIDFYFGGLFEYHGGSVPSEFAVLIMDPNNIVSKMQLNFNSVAQDTPFVQEWAIRCDGINAPGGGWSATDTSTMTWDLLKTRLLFGIGAIGSVGGSPNADPSGTKIMKVHHLWIRARTRYDNTGILKSLQFVPQYGPVTTTTMTRGGQSIFTNNTTIQQIGGSYEMRGQGISNLFVPAQGPKFLSSMTAGSGHTKSDIIKDPAHVIEYLLRAKCGLSGDEIGASASKIDRSSFNAVGSTTGSRSGWTVAVSMLERKSVFDYINDICREYHMSLVLTQDGRYRVVAHDSGTPVYTVTAQDIYFDGIPQIFIQTTTNDQIYNDIILQYQFDYTTSKTRQATYVSDTGFTGNLTTNLSDQTGTLR